MVASRLPPDPRYIPPPGTPLQELRTTLEWGLRGSGEQPERPSVTADGLAAALDRVHRELLPLLALLGPDAVCQDPSLPLRLADGTWATDAEAAARLPDLPSRLPVPLGDDVPGPTTAGAPAQWARHGPPDRLVPGQMALPAPLLNALWAQKDPVALPSAHLAGAGVTVSQPAAEGAQRALEAAVDGTVEVCRHPCDRPVHPVTPLANTARSPGFPRYSVPARRRAPT
ncbi:hypothetical protein ACFYO2_08355 [Streptomyces sp. NPDC006602]|uniref:hypothetical protein n=1 Tax=Streptomyces sp. NPDC006602 TaxID=3364751 RepID=UPI00368D4DA3